MSKTNPRQIKIVLMEGEYTHGEHRLLWMTLLATIACAVLIVSASWISSLKSNTSNAEDLNKIEVKHNVIKAAIGTITGDMDQHKHDRFYGECPNHPNLEFYARFCSLKETPIFLLEKDPKEKNKYPWEEVQA
ncbi:hypothetical protein V8E51_001611 [Hyaloscypha variabilis]